MRIITLMASSTLALLLTACVSIDSSADLKLASQVLQSINAHNDLRTDRLHVQTSDGVVFLNGMADSWREYYEAEEIARAVPGVRQVVNKIAVENRYG